MILSGVFAVLSDAFNVFRRVGMHVSVSTQQVKGISCMEKLQKLISYTNCLPEVDVDCIKSVKFVCGTHGHHYVTELRFRQWNTLGKMTICEQRPNQQEMCLISRIFVGCLSCMKCQYPPSFTATILWNFFPRRLISLSRYSLQEVTT